MRKFFIMLSMCILTATAFAADIIITRDSRSISAKIEKIGLDVIEYRMADNLNGPLHTIALSDVASVVYENGTVQAFDNKKQPMQQNTSNNIGGKQLYFYDNSPLIEEGGEIYQNGILLKEEEWVKILEEYCPEAHAHYVGFDLMEEMGDYMFWFGVGLMGSGALWWGLGEEVLYNSSWISTGKGMFWGGVGLTCVGLPLALVGFFQKDKCIELYNSKCVEGLTYNLTAGQNGIGLALKF